MVTTSISFSTIEYTMNLSLIVDKRTINLTNINHLKKRYFIGKEIFKTYGRINFLCVIEIDKDSLYLLYDEPFNNDNDLESFNNIL